MSLITKKTCFFVTCGNEWAKELTFSKTGWLFPSKTVPKQPNSTLGEQVPHLFGQQSSVEGTFITPLLYDTDSSQHLSW